MNLEDLSAAEANLGKVLVLLQRVLPRLDESGRAGEVQSALRQAAISLESARRAHEQQFSPGTISASQRVATGVSPETIAIIAAAVSMVLDRPYRIVSVQQIEAPVPAANVWGLEGRTQIFQSHRVR